MSETPCPECGGTGLIFLSDDERPKIGDRPGPPEAKRCMCRLREDILNNVERGFHGLTSARPIRSSPLMEKLNTNLWITASEPVFWAHLRHVAVRQPPTWWFKVVSDSDLMTAWLGSVALKGKQIYDPDALDGEGIPSLAHITLVDLIDPPELLVLYCGVKSARNAAMPEVFLETLAHREHKKKPTWVFDQPGKSIASAEHRCYSYLNTEFLERWDHTLLSVAESPVVERKVENKLQTPATGKQPPAPTVRGSRVTFSDMAKKSEDGS